MISDYDGTNRRKQWVYCSLEEPFVAFDFPDEEDGFVYFHYLSPANSLEIGGYNLGSYNLYWAVCHDRFNVDSFALTSTARQMGYNEGIANYQMELPKAFFEEVINSQ